MTTIYEIPLQTGPQIFTVSLGQTIYTLTLLYRNHPLGGWVLDIGDINNNPILTGIPLVTGTNLLQQYGYLDFGGGLYVQTTDDPDAVPTFASLGGTGLIYWVTNP